MEKKNLIIPSLIILGVMTFVYFSTPAPFNSPEEPKNPAEIANPDDGIPLPPLDEYNSKGGNEENNEGDSGGNALPGHLGALCTTDSECNAGLCCAKGGYFSGQCRYKNKLYGGTCTTITSLNENNFSNNAKKEDTNSQIASITKTIQEHIPNSEWEKWAIIGLIIFILLVSALVIFLAIRTLKKNSQPNKTQAKTPRNSQSAQHTR